MGTGGAQAGSWEERVTGGQGSGLLDDDHYQGCSATLRFFSKFWVYCLDLVDEDTWGRGGLCLLVLRKDAILLYVWEGWLQIGNLGNVGSLGSRPNLVGEGTGGRDCLHTLLLEA